MVVPEAGLLIIQRHQEQVGGANGAQQRRRVRPAGDGLARISGQLALAQEPGCQAGVPAEAYQDAAVAAAPGDILTG